MTEDEESKNALDLKYSRSYSRIASRKTRAGGAA